MLAALLGDLQPVTVDSTVDRLEAALDSGTEAGDLGIAPGAVTELRSAIELVRGGRSSAAVSALLAARSALVST